MARALADKWHLVSGLICCRKWYVVLGLICGAKWHVDVTGTLSPVMLPLSRPSRQSYANRFFAQLKN